jgi:hypothetical protein
MILNEHTHRIKIYHNAVGHICKPNVTLSKSFCEIDSVDTHTAALDYTDEHIRNFGGLTLGEGGECVDMITIDSLGLDGVCLMKLDIEGSEKLAIWGARKTIRKNMPIIVYEDNWKTVTPQMRTLLNVPDEVVSFDIPSFLMELGYDKENVVVIADNNIWFPPKL